MTSAIRHAIWFDQTRPREGVLRFGKDSGRNGGVSPQPVKKRCWWSRVRSVGSGVAVKVVGLREVAGASVK